MTSSPSLILASASTARRRMLHDAGLHVTCRVADVDEAAVKQSMPELPAAELALQLACLKALAVASQEPRALVIGADQVLECGAELFDKPSDRTLARRTLLRLRNKRHCLVSAVAVASGPTVLWRHVDRAELHMRAFSDAFLDAYLESAEDDILGSVGAYRLEGPGVQLFERISGDVFTILGMPLLPLLAWLRQQGALPI